MGYLHRIARRTLPTPLLYDLEHIDLPRGPAGVGRVAAGFNVIRSHYRPNMTIRFLPQQPLPGATRGAIAYKLCRLLGYGITSDPSQESDAIFKYTRETFSTPLSDVPDGQSVINNRSTDISKRTVSATFEEVFGYTIGVDPTAYEGKIVVKSNLNSVHDGHLIDGPIAPTDVQENCAYQRAIDNTVSDQNSVLDYRVPIHGDQIPLVYLKYRPIASRFSNKSAHAVIEEPGAVFSPAELDVIHRFVQRMGIDYGELDVLRDTDERIYIVDVNPAPWGPPIGLKKSDRAAALARLGISFRKLIQDYAR